MLCLVLCGLCDASLLVQLGLGHLLVHRVGAVLLGLERTEVLALAALHLPDVGHALGVQPLVLLLALADVALPLLDGQDLLLGLRLRRTATTSGRGHGLLQLVLGLGLGLLLGCSLGCLLGLGARRLLGGLGGRGVALVLGHQLLHCSLDLLLRGVGPGRLLLERLAHGHGVLAARELQRLHVGTHHSQPVLPLALALGRHTLGLDLGLALALSLGGSLGLGLGLAGLGRTDGLAQGLTQQQHEVEALRSGQRQGRHRQLREGRHLGRGLGVVQCAVCSVLGLTLDKTEAAAR